MQRTATVGLQTTVSDLRQVSRRLQQILPSIEAGPLRDDLQQMQRQADAAVRYYCSLLPAERPAPLPASAGRFAEAAVVPISGVGLTPFGFAFDRIIKTPHTDE